MSARTGPNGENTGFLGISVFQAADGVAFYGILDNSKGQSTKLPNETLRWPRPVPDLSAFNMTSQLFVTNGRKTMRFQDSGKYQVVTMTLQSLIVKEILGVFDRTSAPKLLVIK